MGSKEINIFKYMFGLDFYSYLEESYDQKDNRLGMRKAKAIGILFGLILFSINVYFALDYKVVKPDQFFAAEAAFLIIGLLTPIAVEIGYGIFAVRSWANDHMLINAPMKSLYMLLCAVTFEYILLVPITAVYAIVYGTMASKLTPDVPTYLDKFHYFSFKQFNFLLEKSNLIIIAAIILIWLFFYFLNFTLPAIISLDYKGNEHLAQRFTRREEFDGFVFKSDMTISSYGSDFYSKKYLVNRAKELAAENFVLEKTDEKTLYKYTYEPETNSSGSDLKIQKQDEVKSEKKSSEDSEWDKLRKDLKGSGISGGRHNRY